MYKQIKGQPDLQQSIDLIKQAPFGKRLVNFGWLLALVFVNWGFEAKKWQVLLKPLQPINFFTAFKSVLSGVTLSINTPNRIGEYGGRILYIRKEKELKRFHYQLREV